MRTAVALIAGLLVGAALGRWDERHPFEWWLRLAHWEHLWIHRLPGIHRVPGARRRLVSCRFCACDRERADARAVMPRRSPPRST